MMELNSLLQLQWIEHQPLIAANTASIQQGSYAT
jgi:hypothetical protein